MITILSVSSQFVWTASGDHNKVAPLQMHQQKIVNGFANAETRCACHRSRGRIENAK